MKTKTQFTNRILSLVLALMMVVGMLPTISFTASAAETEYDGVIGELYYKVDKENNVTTIFGNGALSSVSSLANVMTSNVVIEEGVTSIGNIAFRGLSSLEELTVKGDVTIGNYAFQGCASLETVTFMGNVTSVGFNAFYGCASLTNINYYGTTEPSYTNTLSYITLYSFNGVSFCGLIPSNSPATEVSGWNTNMVAYSDGVTQYFTYNNYLYQVKYTNLKTVSETWISYDTYDRVLFYVTSSTHLRLYTSDDFEQMIATDMFPQTPGGVLNCYSSYEERVIDTSKPVVVITCIAVNEPTWSWNGTASATATFIAKDADVFTKANATISSESDAANTKTIYTATVTFNGTKYTDTKIVSVPHEHPICGDSDCSDSAHTVNDSWTAWDGTTAFPGGNVYLSDDVILTAPISVTGIVSLCLNGHSINAAGGYFDVSSNGTLNLCSCKDNGVFKRTSTTNALISADNGATANLYNVILDGGAVWGGTTDTTLLRGTANSGIVSSSPLIDAGYQRTASGHITLNSGVVLQNNECSDAGDGGAVTIGEDGTLVINGAVIRNNAKEDGNAGAIKAYAGAEITLNSGEIYGNSAYKHGGAIQIFGGDSTDNADAVLTMNGGAIRNNKAAGVGGGIAVSNYSQFVMNGGSIIENTTTDSQKRGGGVGFADADTAMSVSGNAVISGNTANNLYIGTNSCNILTVGAMGSAANIGVTMKSSSGGVFTISGATYADKFISDSSAYAVAVDGSNLKLVKQFTVSFDNNSGTGSKDSVKVSDGEEYTLPANPFTAPSGYQFKGWATSQNGDVLQDEKIIVSENVTLYAIWKKIPAEMPTVAVSENLTLTYGEYTGQKFTATIEKKDGYTYEYQWIDGNTVISNTDTLAIPDDLTVGEYDYYLAVGAKRIDNGEITWYSNPNLLVKVNPKELDASNVTLSKDAFTYDGNEQKPTVTVNVGGKTLTENTDYTVTWPSDCKNAGTKTITVTFKGNYGGTAQANYEIKQKEIGISWGATEFIPYTGELIVPQATATGLADGYSCEIIVSVVETVDGAGVNPGKWTAKITGLSNPNYKLPENSSVPLELPYTIYANQKAPDVNGVSETIKGKNDGYISGLTTEMEYATEPTGINSSYTKIIDPNMTFVPGTYYVRYVAKDYYYASAYTEVTVGAGRKLTITVPQSQIGYTLTVDKNECDYGEDGITVTFTLAEGYSRTSGFSIESNKTTLFLSGAGTVVLNDITEDIILTVQGVADMSAPNGEIKVAENRWKAILNNITFGLFFKKTQAVTITATDAASGVNTIEYYLADHELSFEELVEITEWEPYNGSFNIDPDNEYVIYARLSDNAGNMRYLNSDGIVLDATAPVISGIENGKTYYTTQKVTVTEKNVASITLNGEDAGNDITLDGNKNATYTIVVTDKAGNSTTVTVTMKPISDLSAPIDTLNKDNVNSSDESVVDGVKAVVAAVDTANATEKEKAALKEITDKATELEKVIDDTKAEIARINEELNKHNADTVNSDDAAALEQLGKDIKALTDGGNLTDAERTALTEDADDVAAMQKTVADTKAENDRISDAVDGYDLATVTSDDKADLEQLLADINKQLQSTNLTDEEISELNGEKKAVEDLLTKIKGTDELIDKLSEDMDGYSEETVKSTDKDAIEQIIEDIDALLETENLTDAEEKALEDAKTKAEGLLDAIEDAAEATTSENTEKVKDVTAENVTPENKTDLEKAKEDLEKALEDNGGNYTDDEKKAIEDEIKRIDDALEVIENVEEVEELIGKLPENITKNDEDAIKAADDAYNALTDYEKSLVDADAKKALDDAKAALAELNKPTDTNSPQTGDNSHLMLWIALLFISGGAVITLTVVDRKRRMASNR